MKPPMTGSTGRALTPLTPAGRVEVNGTAYEAETSFVVGPDRIDIPADRAVVVSGWRIDNRHGLVLLVTDPTAPPAESPASPAESPAPAGDSALPKPPPGPPVSGLDPGMGYWSSRPVAARGGLGGGCVLGIVGAVLGAILGAVIPINFERVRVQGVEAARLTVLGIEVSKSAGPRGELDRALGRVRAGMVVGFAVFGGVVLGGIGVMVRGSRAGP